MGEPIEGSPIGGCLRLEATVLSVLGFCPAALRWKKEKPLQ